ncbi:hypothetical protein [Curtobacterium sp. MCSS17_005]|uniref:hypothetical protein n=1 Tax=Curtobacterium sp. MCSS17_005 TaxID=2175641 RepID=UPI0015E8DC30|nr:hypothetical protein [Curtobacterium sp. MCSS17_005]WIB34499.1 hypothetical protein DEJ20_08555 [Curtobacterium sp. MCSS17_005]
MTDEPLLGIHTAWQGLVDRERIDAVLRPGRGVRPSPEPEPETEPETEHAAVSAPVR